jgi:hypothetical protein
MSLRERTRPGLGIIGDSSGVRLITRAGNDFSDAVRSGQLTAFVPIWLDFVARLELREGGKSATKHQFLMVFDTLV